jgi:two-component system phosphate regulon sensor histidine kinase PhoR
MTHEFKTPISTIGISAEVLSDPEIVNSPERLKNYAEIISGQNKRLESQIEKVLQLAQPDKNKFKLKKEEFDIHKVIKQVGEAFKITVDKKQGVLHCNLKAENSIIRGDKLHTTNIIYNLLDNAFKYSLEKPDITISTRNKDNRLYLEISDKGIGISKKYRKRIFDKFFRIPTGNIHDVKGFGLGLNYVKSIVHSHNWKIKVESEQGKGSRFIIII